jgi:hypothetical protein
MFDTLLLRPSLHCNTPLHITTFHPTTLHYTYRHFTSSHLHFTTLSFSFTHLHSLSFYFTSHHIFHITSQQQISSPKLFLKQVNPFTVLKNFSPFHFTFYFILFICLFVYLSYQPYTSLYFAIPNYKLLPFISLPFTFYFLSPSLPLTGLHFPNPRFENMRFTLEIPYRPFR